MAEPNTAQIFLGPGKLYMAPIGSPEPAAGVIAPVTSPAVSVPWPSAWVALGYTEDGHTWSHQPTVAAIEVAEELLPVKWATTAVQESVGFSLSEISAAKIQTAFNGGTVATASGITTFTPPAPGAEVRIMLGWDSDDGLQRMIWRRCLQVGNLQNPRKKAPNNQVLPCEFRLEKPAGVQPFVHYFDGSLAA